MEQTIHDYDQSLNDLQRQKEQLELMMRKMGEEWEASGPGINWLKTSQLPVLQDDELTETTTTITNHTTIVKEDLTSITEATKSINKDLGAYQLGIPLTPDDSISLTNKGELIHILQQPQPSPEYLQSLLHVNETLLAQSLAATPLIDNSGYYHIPTAAATTAVNVLSPSSEGSSDVYTPILTSSSSILQTPPTTPDDEEVLCQ